MKKTLTLIAIALLPTLAFSQKLKTERDSASYMLGNDIGQFLKESSLDINFDVFLQGIQNYYNNKGVLFVQADRMLYLQNWQMAQASKEYEKNKKIGEEFLAKNKKQTGVITTGSGLQYKVIKQGGGKKPLATDVVKVNYKGTLIDGTVFDSSYDRGEPIEFPLNNVIPGWTEGLQYMPVGSKYIFYIPCDLGYGERTAGTIPAGSTLIFEVELLDAKANTNDDIEEEVIEIVE